MSNRDTILGAYATLLGTITTSGGYANNVAKVAQNMLYWDQEETFPVIMVLGGNEEFEDTLDGSVYSTLHVLIRGYSQNTSDPDAALNSIIADVLKVLESGGNTYAAKQRILLLETDEGWFNFQEQGFGYFNLELTVFYGFTRGTP